MIMSFADKRTKMLYEGKRVAQFEGFRVQAERKLQALDSATTLGFLGSLPGNRLEALGGDRIGQHSIRINQRYRICFVWRDGNAHDVEITDYH